MSAVFLINIALLAISNRSISDILSCFYYLQLCCFYTFYDVRMPANAEIWLDNLRNLVSFRGLSPDAIMAALGIDWTVKDMLGIVDG